ncbi:MAG: DUF1178 family protein [Pseudomonadota bacterium]
MIRYNLHCEHGHRFDSWFPDSAGFENQVSRGLVLCPHCGSANVTKALMAPAVAVDSDAPGPLSAPATAAQTALQELRRKVEAESDYVGSEFADEARRIHLGEAEARGIWGEATNDDAKALHDEGIPVAPLPFMRRNDG